MQVSSAAYARLRVHDPLRLLMTLPIFSPPSLSGGPNDPEVDLSVTEVYTGVAIVDGAPYGAPPAPAGLELVAWDDAAVTLSLAPPPAGAAGGPVQERPPPSPPSY